MRTLRAITLLALLSAPVLSAAQQAPLKSTVAVMPLTCVVLNGKMDNKSCVDVVTSMIITEFSAKPTIQMVERQLVEDLITKQKLMVSGRMSEADARRAGELLGAQYILLGSVLIQPNEARFDLRIVDVETGTYPHDAFKKSRKPDDLIGLVVDMATDFTKDLKLPDKAAIAAAAIVPVPAALSYSRGLDYEKRGRKDLAARMYQRALELFPNHTQAKAALDRVR